jgi:hypothetical protein
MKHAIEMASFGMIYPPIFMKVNTGVQAILRSCFRKLRGCNNGTCIIGGRDLYSMALKWPHVA